MITDQEARRIACGWHGGGGSALYALCSTGAIDTARADHQVVEEVYDCVCGATDTYLLEEMIPVLRELVSLLDYLDQHDTRGPVDGWSSMPWEEDSRAQ